MDREKGTLKDVEKFPGNSTPSRWENCNLSNGGMTLGLSRKGLEGRGVHQGVGGTEKPGPVFWNDRNRVQFKKKVSRKLPVPLPPRLLRRKGGHLAKAEKETLRP